MDRILLIDDNKEYCEQVKKTLNLRGIDLTFYTQGKEGLESALNNGWNVVLLDVYLNQEINGLDILKTLVEHKPQLPIVMISGASTLQTAVDATRMGAYDFLEKPLDIDRLIVTISRAMEMNKLSNLSKSLLKELEKQPELIGQSEALKKIYNDVVHIADTDTKILITGESGVGKDIIAKIIHFQSGRVSEPFISLNCAAIPANLVETELFGYKKGAFTGAYENNPGMIARAGCGTLFLDEIGELSPSSQAKLLKFLNDNEYSPVGGNEVCKSEARIITATNKNLEEEIAKGNFREDLFYRLNVIHIHVPPLRERVEDIEPLCNYFLKRAREKFGKNITHFSNEAIELIKKQRWQGNVRQLKATVYRMILFSHSNIIDYGTAATAIQMDRTNDTLIESHTYDEALIEFEKLYFINQLQSNKYNLKKTAKSAGISVENLKDKLELLKIE
ncbi:MAG: sigma-54-dependent Fis family transcriptional regulator [Calditrichaceae bacterium]|nr:sigma-54-dependent Fis family transcriptional regulator [Calditrichaceae bacterium]